jgi:hypothetical protein
MSLPRTLSKEVVLPIVGPGEKPLKSPRLDFDFFFSSSAPLKSSKSSVYSCSLGDASAGSKISDTMDPWTLLPARVVGKVEGADTEISGEFSGASEDLSNGEDWGRILPLVDLGLTICTDLVGGGVGCISPGDSGSPVYGFSRTALGWVTSCPACGTSKNFLNSLSIVS